MNNETLNVLGESILTCSLNPMTGWTRTGCCETGPMDHGTHTVCAIVTKEFLEFSASRGNDLMTPRPEYQFAGLKPGDRWCLCVTRWMEALNAGVAPNIIAEASHSKTLDYVEMDILKDYFIPYDSKNVEE